MRPADDNRENGRQDPLGFIAKQLHFDDAQLEKMKTINKAHHQKMKRISDDLRGLKDDLFKELSNTDLQDETVDSLTTLIGEKQKERETEVFYHFKSIRDICTEKQSEKFEAIIKDALRKGVNNGPEGQRPPPREGHRPAPRN